MNGRALKRGKSQNIDLLADGYVIVPPSRHRIGKPYTWMNLPEQRLRRAPAWAIKLLSEGCATTSRTKVCLPDPLPVVDVSKLRVSLRIQELIRRGEDPERYPSRSEAEFAVLKALIQAGCADGEIAAVLLNSCNGISNKPLEKGKEWLEGEIARARATDEPVETIDLCPWKCSIDLLTEEPPEINWLMDQVIPAQSVVLITSREGTMKTWLTLYLANALAEGKDWNGLCAQSVPVLYLDAEMPFDIFHARLYAVGASQNLNIWRWQDDGFPTSLDDPLLLQASKSHGVIIIDTLKRFMGKLEENSSTDMAVITGQLRNLTRAGATVIVLHHAAKDAANPGYRGSTELGAGADVILNIEKKEHNGQTLLDLKLQKTRYAEDPRLRFTVERSATRPIFTRMASSQEKEERAAVPQLLKLQTIIASQATPSQTQVMTAAKEAGLGSRNTILKWLAQGEGDYWTSHVDGRSRVYKPLSCPSVHSLAPRIGLDKKRPVQSIRGDKEVGQVDKSTQATRSHRRCAHVG